MKVHRFLSPLVFTGIAGTAAAQAPAAIQVPYLDAALLIDGWNQESGIGNRESGARSLEPGAGVPIWRMSPVGP